MKRTLDQASTHLFKSQSHRAYHARPVLPVSIKFRSHHLPTQPLVLSMSKSTQISKELRIQTVLEQKKTTTEKVILPTPCQPQLASLKVMQTLKPSGTSLLRNTSTIKATSPVTAVNSPLMKIEEPLILVMLLILLRFMIS